MKEQGKRIENKNAGLSCALSVVNCFIWLFGGGFCFMLFMWFGGLEFLFTAFLGDYAVIILFIAGFVFALSPVYLIFIKRKVVRFSVAYSLMAAFIIFIIVFSAAAASYFKDFTKEKWVEYPQIRDWMIDDLSKNHGITGMDEEGVIELLGSPDGKSDTVLMYFMRKESRSSGYIEVIFQNGKVVSVRYIINT